MDKAAPAMAPEFLPFFVALDARVLRFPRCDHCGRFHWYPMKQCPHCGGKAITWTDIAGRGRVFTWTEVRHAFDPGFCLPPPYIVALVEFSDAPGVRLVANLELATADQVRIGLEVEATFPGAGRVAFRPIA